MIIGQRMSTVSSEMKTLYNINSNDFLNIITLLGKYKKMIGN